MFLTAGWTKKKPLQEKGLKFVVAALRICTPDSYDPLEVVTACGKLLSDLLYSIQTEYAVLCSVFLIILFAEVCKVMFKDFIQLVSAAGYIILSKVNSCVPE